MPLVGSPKANRSGGRGQTKRSSEDLHDCRGQPFPCLRLGKGNVGHVIHFVFLFIIVCDCIIFFITVNYCT